MNFVNLSLRVTHLFVTFEESPLGVRHTRRWSARKGRKERRKGLSYFDNSILEYLGLFTKLVVFHREIKKQTPQKKKKAPFAKEKLACHKFGRLIFNLEERPRMGREIYESNEANVVELQRYQAEWLYVRQSVLYSV